MDNIYIGTSGWAYKSWEKTFYPPQLPAREEFEFYAGQFRTVEINATFYRLPTLSMVKGWRDRAPAGFVFALKGSRFITHIKRIANLGGAVNRYFRRVEPMRQKIGVVLWQLPPTLKKDLDRLRKFLKRVPDKYRHAVEFREPSWLAPDTFDLLRECGASHVSLSSQAMPMDLTVTADPVYIRFHGLVGGAAHDYSRGELEPWAEHIRQQAAAGRTVYAYFNNDANVRAPANARMLIEMVGATGAADTGNTRERERMRAAAQRMARAA